MRFILVLLLTITGCSSATYTRHNLGPLEGEFWVNRSLSLNQPKLNFELSKIKGSCNMECHKLPVPSPSCVQPPKQDCTGMTGFALGFCRSNTPSMKCDYSSVNIAKQARSEIFYSCMSANGWQLEKLPIQASDSLGGLFEYVAYDQITNIIFA